MFYFFLLEKRLLKPLTTRVGSTQEIWLGETFKQYCNKWRFFLFREDNDGFFTVVGRIKEIIITAGGENIAPTNIEEEIKKELEEVISHIYTV